MRALLLVFLILVAPSVALKAQGVRGVVVDSTGRHLAEADIIVGDPGVRARSDSLGAFQVVRLKAGRLRVRVRLIGYRPYESTVNVSDARWTDVRVVLRRMPQLLADVRITDTRLCTPNSLEGFECRRQSGTGMFRDAAEIRSMRPSAWADMLDGMPHLRRIPLMTPDGLDWRPSAPPSRCLMEIYNGEDPMFDGHVRKVRIDELVTRDVVAIEYYVKYADVPEHFKRFAWPKGESSPCALLVYWLREAKPRPRRTMRDNDRIIVRPVEPSPRHPR